MVNTKVRLLTWQGGSSLDYCDLNLVSSNLWQDGTHTPDLRDELTKLLISRRVSRKLAKVDFEIIPHASSWQVVVKESKEEPLIDWIFNHWRKRNALPIPQDRHDLDLKSMCGCCLTYRWLILFEVRPRTSCQILDVICFCEQQVPPSLVDSACLTHFAAFLLTLSSSFYSCILTSLLVTLQPVYVCCVVTLTFRKSLRGPSTSRPGYFSRVFTPIIRAV